MPKASAKFWDFLKVLSLFALVALLSAFLAAYSSEEITGQVDVIDGDSLKVGGKEIRLFGIDAPEFSQKCKRTSTGADFNCGRVARNHLKKLIGNQSVNCSGWEKDKYDRLLATCFTGEHNLNKSMVFDGWAVAFGDYERQQQQAERNARGLWAGEFVSPSQWRQDAKQAHSNGLFGALKFW